MGGNYSAEWRISKPESDFSGISSSPVPLLKNKASSRTKSEAVHEVFQAYLGGFAFCPLVVGSLLFLVATRPAPTILKNLA